MPRKHSRRAFDTARETDRRSTAQVTDASAKLCDQSVQREGGLLTDTCPAGYWMRSRSCSEDTLVTVHNNLLRENSSLTWRRTTTGPAIASTREVCASSSGDIGRPCYKTTTSFRRLATSRNEASYSCG